MPGQPKQIALEQTLEEIAKEELGPDARAIDWVVTRVEDGCSVNAIREEIVASGRLPFDFSRPWLSRVINGLAPDAKGLLAEARKQSAHALVEDAQDIVDATEGEKNREAIASAKLRSDIRLWRAGKYNREDLGERGPVVQLNIGALHLDALKRRNISGPTATAATLPAPAVDAEFEVIPQAADQETNVA